jgi:hypothetical protein
MTAIAPTATDLPIATRAPRLLVVVDQPCAALELCTRVRAYAGTDGLDALVIAPTHDGVATPWYIDEDAARADAVHRLRACVACLSLEGIRACGQLGDPDPVQAIADALHQFPADAILLVSTAQPPGWPYQRVIDRIRRRFDQPIEHVVMPAQTLTRSG